MNNDEQELDDLLRQRFEQYAPEPNEDTWAQIADKLPPPIQRPKRWTKAPLLLLLLLGVSIWVYDGISHLTPTSKTTNQPKNKLPAAMQPVTLPSSTTIALKSIDAQAKNLHLTKANSCSSETSKTAKANPRLGGVPRSGGVGKAVEVAKDLEAAKLAKANPRLGGVPRSGGVGKAVEVAKDPEIAQVAKANPHPNAAYNATESSEIPQPLFNLSLLSSISLKTKPAFLTVPAIKNQQSPTIAVPKRKNSLEYWLSVKPFLVFQQVEAMPQPEIGYLINMSPYAPLSAQRMGGQLQLNVRKKWSEKLSWQLGVGYSYLPQWIDYEWFTGDFKVTETPKNGLLIERNAKNYAEKSSLHLGSVSGALRYRLGQKRWLPTLETGGTWQYNFNAKRPLANVSLGLNWQAKRLNFGPRVDYYLSQFEDNQGFVQINPYVIGASVGWRLR